MIPKNGEAVRSIRAAMDGLQDDDGLRSALDSLITRWEKNAEPPQFIGAASGGIIDGRLAVQLRDNEQTTYDAQMTPICVLDTFNATIMNADQLRFDLENYMPLLLQGDATLGVGAHSQNPVLELLINGVPVAIRMSTDRLAALGDQIAKHLGRGETQH